MPALGWTWCCTRESNAGACRLATWRLYLAHSSAAPDSRTATPAKLRHSSLQHATASTTYRPRSHLCRAQRPFQAFRSCCFCIHQVRPGKPPALLLVFCGSRTTAPPRSSHRQSRTCHRCVPCTLRCNYTHPAGNCKPPFRCTDQNLQPQHPLPARGTSGVPRSRWDSCPTLLSHKRGCRKSLQCPPSSAPQAM